MSRINRHVARRLVVVVLLLLAVGAWLVFNPDNYQKKIVQAESSIDPNSAEAEFLAITILGELEVKPKDTSQKYNRKDFYSSWSTYNGCDMRNVILQRDLEETVLDGCLVMSGVLHDPYTGEVINFVRGAGTSSAVQIDHVVALSNAWATGAFNLDKDGRKAVSQDPLNLLAVDGPANQQKSDQDASEWLPSNVDFQCRYVARQISVKYKYVLWVTPAEKTSMQEVLSTCPDEPTVGLEDSGV